MEHRRVKRLPVMRGAQVVGIVSRANLMRALAAIGREAPAPAMSDAAIRKQLLAEFEKQPWVPVALIDATVKDGVVELWGTILEGSQGEAIRVLAENVPGVKKVVSHLTWVEPMSGMVISDADMRAGAWCGSPSDEIVAASFRDVVRSDLPAGIAIAASAPCRWWRRGDVAAIDEFAFAGPRVGLVVRGSSTSRAGRWRRHPAYGRLCSSNVTKQSINPVLDQ